MTAPVQNTSGLHQTLSLAHLRWPLNSGSSVYKNTPLLLICLERCWASHGKAACFPLRQICTRALVHALAPIEYSTGNRRRAGDSLSLKSELDTCSYGLPHSDFHASSFLVLVFHSYLFSLHACTEIGFFGVVNCNVSLCTSGFLDALFFCAFDGIRKGIRSLHSRLVFNEQTETT